MAISSPTNIPASTTPVQTSPQAKPDQAESAVSLQRKAHQEMNAQILQSSMEVSLTSGDRATALLYKSAIDKINEMLAPEFGPDAIQNAAANQDNSPEAVAGRIVSLSTAFFSSYAQQHAKESPEDVARNFVDLIRGGFEQGFGEAKDILKGLGVLGGNVESEIGKTYDLVHKGLDDFLAARLGDIGNKAEPAADKAA